MIDFQGKPGIHVSACSKCRHHFLHISFLLFVLQFAANWHWVHLKLPVQSLVVCPHRFAVCFSTVTVFLSDRRWCELYVPLTLMPMFTRISVVNTQNFQLDCCGGITMHVYCANEQLFHEKHHLDCKRVSHISDTLILFQRFYIQSMLQQSPSVLAVMQQATTATPAPPWCTAAAHSTAYTLMESSGAYR